MARLDPHSFNDDRQPSTRHIDWHARVDFEKRQLTADATLRFHVPGEGPLDLDTRGLDIETVFGPDGALLPFELFAPEPILGERLRIELPRDTPFVRIRYRTSPAASALQWLTPEQTAGKRHPFLFTQCQAIHARSVLPCQDTPRLRVTYTAQLSIPAALRALVAAAPVERMVMGTEAVERYEMRQSIPPYLFAFAVGDLHFRQLGPRSRVWAEPSVVDRAAEEFTGVDAMLTAAEAIFGPYDWEQFDLLTMPPSFPYGGMENPRLTFLTPTLLAGDRSLVNVVAHELAHSWTGNLVTNASANDFWLNEGFTVFAERHILEALEGPDVAALHSALGRYSLDEAVSQFKAEPELTRLRTRLEGVDPDEAFSQVPYEKGYLFLRALEDHVGREAFLAFLKKYLQRFRFQSIVTEDFLSFARAELPGALEAVKWELWVDGSGVPENAPVPRSARLDAVESLHGLPTDAQARAWTPAEWQVFLKGFKGPLPLARVADMDARFGLTARTNFEVLVAWLVLAVRSGHAPAVERTERVLGEVGRMKYLKPLYAALLANPQTRGLAAPCFERYRAGYHPIAAQAVEGLLGRGG